MIAIDVAIFGGGVAGLWLHDTLIRKRVTSILLEAEALGAGQTICSQGIIHGGLKYTLMGMLTGSAAQIRDMPDLWRKSLQGQTEPDLSRTVVRAESCHLWRTDSFSSRMGMIGAKIGLRITPQNLNETDRPDILANCPGQVSLLPEQVISPNSFLQDLLSQHTDSILKIDADRGCDFELNSDGQVTAIHLGGQTTTGRELSLAPKQVVFAAGAGNAKLREAINLKTPVMQRRPLHMVMVREKSADGSLPELNGHCVDGAKTRVTITSDTDTQGRMVWQMGGQISEDGVALQEAELVERAASELQAVLPGLRLENLEAATYRVDRAEGMTANGLRPETVQILCDGNVITAWPAKLALAPVLAEQIAKQIPNEPRDVEYNSLHDWPRPTVALPPWETATNWLPLQQNSGQSTMAHRKSA